MKLFDGKNWWAVILGASSGMGLATAKKLGAAGMNLFLVHRDRRSVLEEAEKAFDEIRQGGVEVIARNVDGLNEERRAELVQELKDAAGPSNVRVLLHSISKGNLKLMGEVSEHSNDGIKYPEALLGETDFGLTIQAMASSMLSWTQSLIAADLFESQARVIGLTSEGDQRVWKGYGAVGAAKASLDVIAKYMAVELAPLGLRTNIIQAGITETPSQKMIPGSEIMTTSALERNPMKRLTRPQDVANVVYLMAQEEADWINGSKISVDGGEHLV